jgi:hypothetical protein
MLQEKVPLLIVITLLFLPNVAILSGCESNHPSEVRKSSSKVLQEDKAKRLVNKFMQTRGGPEGTITYFQGVVQNESQSSATARLEVSNFQYKDKDIFSNKITEETYSGKVNAYFTRYTDDTWALTKFALSPSGIMDEVWWHTQVKED